ncbi:type I-B CRISPR-associated protein Cas7/Cst2/DevR [Rosistilla oblonga]|uniref:type I-B CRISPR-associated protein Cas7/Cst2/DevR n=1 Tax=Rosistilla oblonga TaxID=2527990 RepID=UPI003A96E588
MSLHIFANIVTDYGTAANNRGENEGNTTTLQKLIWKGGIHTTVSAEAIRFSVRRLLAEMEPEGTNRTWNETSRTNEWKSPEFKEWEKTKAGKPHIDDDLLGFMSAKASKEENTAGTANVRRAVLEVTRAVSLTPWPGDTTFNAASPGATPSAAKKGNNPVPYGAEIHATRYQYGIAMTPDRLHQADRAAKALQAISNLRTVAGNHGRFLFDFSPAAVVYRATEDPAPRLLYCFNTDDEGNTIDATELLRRVKAGDIAGSELVVGGTLSTTETGLELAKLGAEVHDGIKAATNAICERIVQATA